VRERPPELSRQRACRLLTLERSSFYYTSKPLDPDREKLEMDLRDRIDAICLAYPRYGCRRVTATLRREGWPINHKRVLRLLHQDNLLCHVQRRWIQTTNSWHRYPIYPNLLLGLEIRAPDQVWLADITYIRLRGEFVYLAVILDAFLRKVVGGAPCLPPGHG
jgi:putative transposase